MFANPPISPFLNSLFITLDNAFPLFGTAAFAICCFYLIGARHCATAVAIYKWQNPNSSLSCAN